MENLANIITLNQLTEIIVKEHNPKGVQDEKRNKNLHSALRPIRIMAITSYISLFKDAKVVVLAGNDETKQWEIIYNYNPNIGAILIPTLKLNKDDNVVHDSLTKVDVYSKSQVKKQLKEGNFFQWVMQVFVALNPSEFDKSIYSTSLKSGKDSFKDDGSIDHDILAGTGLVRQ